MVQKSPLILIVDDEPEIREIIANVLSDAGYQTAEAGNGKEAQAIVSRESVSLIISDVRMPVCSGIDLLRAVGKKVPVILISGFSEVSQTEAIKLGAIGFFSKPMHLDALLECVEEALKTVGTLK